MSLRAGAQPGAYKCSLVVGNMSSMSCEHVFVEHTFARRLVAGHMPRHPGLFVLCGGLGCVSIWHVWRVLGVVLILWFLLRVQVVFELGVMVPRPVATLGLPTVVLDAGSASSECCEVKSSPG